MEGGQPVGIQDIESALTGGDPRKLRHAGAVVDLVLNAPARLPELFDCVFSPDEIVRMRAADALEKVCRQRPDLLEPHIERLLVDMAAIDQPSVQWHLAQILDEVELDQVQRARALEILERHLTESGDWIVINLSLETLAGFARQDPGLTPRLLAALQRHGDAGYKSVVSRVRKLQAEFGG